MNTNQQMTTQTTDKVLTFAQYETEFINGVAATLNIETTDFISKAAIDKCKRVSSLIYLYRKLDYMVNNDLSKDEMRERCLEMLSFLRDVCLVFIGFEN